MRVVLLPAAAFRNPWYLILPVLASLAVFFRALDERRGQHAVMLFDAVGLAVYCVVGTRIALLGGMSPVAAVLGLVTAIGGGLLRDVVAAEPPAVFGGRGWYALPALVGATITALLGWQEWLNIYTMVGTMLVVLTLRWISMRGQWTAPGAEVSGKTQRQRLDPHDEPPVPDIRDRDGEDGPPADPGEADTSSQPTVDPDGRRDGASA